MTAENYMVSVTGALEMVGLHSETLGTESLPLSMAAGSVLATDVCSPLDLPPFDRSAMDGYALHSHEKLKYILIGQIKAGDNPKIILRPGEAVRIFTGARVPDSADTVVVQEKTVRENDSILLQGAETRGNNIRSRGEQLIKGELALQQGIVLSPPALGFLAEMGLTQVEVFRRPKVGIVITGNELVQAGNSLKDGQIYEGNSKMLQAALEQQGIKETKIYWADDSFSMTCDVLARALEENDALLISGGISVGDHDHVASALEHLEVETLFYKVKQKPGKPLLYGKKNKKIIFALPGNPASALTCFYVYVVPALQKTMGRANFGLPRKKMKVNSIIENQIGRAQFLKARLKGKDGVEVLEGQGSAMLHTYALANALIYIPDSVEKVSKGDLVEVLLL